MKTSLTVPIAIVVGGIIVAGAVYLSIQKVPTTDTGNDTPSLLRPVDATDHILGNPAAKVLIVEYSDFDCDFCKTYHETLHQIIAAAGANGQVAWVLREFPLIEIHPNALPSARAAECVAETAGNDAFWKFTDILFQNQPVDPIRFGEYAKAAGISGDAFATCYANAATTVEAGILAGRQNALAMGAEGTPYSIILTAGKAPVLLKGAYPYDAVKQLIDQALTPQ